MDIVASVAYARRIYDRFYSTSARKRWRRHVRRVANSSRVCRGTTSPSIRDRNGYLKSKLWFRWCVVSLLRGLIDGFGRPCTRGTLQLASLCRLMCVTLSWRVGPPVGVTATTSLILESSTSTGSANSHLLAMLGLHLQNARTWISDVSHFSSFGNVAYSC